MPPPMDLIVSYVRSSISNRKVNDVEVLVDLLLKCVGTRPLLKGRHKFGVVGYLTQEDRLGKVRAVIKGPWRN